MTIVVTNLLTKINFSNVPATMPSVWDLSGYIPNGLLDTSHLQVRYRPVAGYWQAWGAVQGWNPVTKEATFFVPLAVLEVEFRRSTPRYAPWLDPLSPTSRQSELELQTNADQGLFVATEWAAQYGINPYQTLLTDPGQGPNSLGLVQNTQNHWGQYADYTKKTWDFQFAGGYIDRAHVKVQVLLPSGWQGLTIDTSENDPLVPSTAPFRFVGDFQLHLELGTLGEKVTGLIIYRQTPRSVNVESPSDGVRLTAPGLEPGARHGFFVAVEIGEELAKRAPTCECALYYTSTIYPIIVKDTMQLNPAALFLGGLLNFGDDYMSVAIPALQNGSLLGNITFVDYLNQRDVNPDSMATLRPILLSGSLIGSITFVDYLNQRDVNPDSMATLRPILQTGSLVVTITFVNYLNQRDVNPDSMKTLRPTLISGSLV